MKQFLFLTLLVRLTAQAAADTIPTRSSITDVTVYFAGAQVSRKAEMKVKKGKFLFLLDQLPQEIDPQSIQTSVGAGCEILSVMHTLHQQNPGRKSPTEKELQRQIESEESRIKLLNHQLKVFELEEKLLLDNSVLGTDNAVGSVSRIKEAADFYRVRLNEIRRSGHEIRLQIEAASETIEDLNVRLNQLTVEKQKVYSRIYILLEAQRDSEIQLNLNYYVPSAGWQPLYDFRVQEINEPFKIVYNASVFQSTGEDWKNVNISLSTHDPSLSGKTKQLQAWYLDRPSPYRKEVFTKGPGSLTGVLTDRQTGEAIPFANVVLLKDGVQVGVATSDLDGRYSIKPIVPGRYTIKAAYIGYQPLEKAIKVESHLAVNGDLNLQSAGVHLDEVNVITYQKPLIDPENKSGGTITREYYTSTASKDIHNVRGARSGVDNDAYGYFGWQSEERETIYTIGNSINLKMMNTDYKIDVPYTIPSNGSDYTLKIRELEVPVLFRYHAIPKLERDVFLSAHIAEWSALNLLSGKASIYFQGTYVGQTYLDAVQTGDTLAVSLGRDKDVIIAREANKRINDRKLNGNYYKEVVGMDISIRNNKKIPISVTVEDQYPLSQRKSIEVELLESPGATVHEKYGMLAWNFKLEPGAKTQMNYRYSVRYPRWTRIVAE